MFTYYYFFTLQAVTLHTDVGDMKIELFCEACPKTCEVKDTKMFVYNLKLLNNLYTYVKNFQYVKFNELETTLLVDTF